MLSPEAKKVHDGSKKFAELLAQMDEATGIMVLANVVALWLAGHQGEGTEAWRERALEEFINRVKKLTTINDRLVQDAIKARREMRQDRRRH